MINICEAEVKNGGTMVMFKKIYAITTENNFYKFRARCSREGYTMGEALTAIVHLFANSRELKLPAKVARQPMVPGEEEPTESVEPTKELVEAAKEIIKKEIKPAKKEKQNGSD